MTELLREQMSAFVDDALPPDESELLLRRLREDGDLGKTYACYHLIGASLRHEPDASELADRVRNALRDEAGTPSRRPLAWRRLQRPALGIAVAASVAVLAIGVLRGLQGPVGVPDAQVAQTASVRALGGSEPESYTVAPRVIPAGTPQHAGNAQLVQYAMRHGNYATMPNPVIMNYRSVVGVGQHATRADEPSKTPPASASEEPQAQ